MILFFYNFFFLCVFFLPSSPFSCTSSHFPSPSSSFPFPLSPFIFLFFPTRPFPFSFFPFTFPFFIFSSFFSPKPMKAHWFWGKQKNIHPYNDCLIGWDNYIMYIMHFSIFSFSSKVKRKWRQYCGMLQANPVKVLILKINVNNNCLISKE